MSYPMISESSVEWKGIRFLDPLGRTFRHDGTYYKAIYPAKIEAAKKLLASSAFRMLQERGFVTPARLTGLRMERYPLVVELDTEYFEVAPGDWNPLLLKDAALAYCDMNIALMEHGCGMHDGHKGNVVVQRNSAPRWCDLGSIVPATEKSLHSLDEFIRYFVYPLQLRARSPHFGKLMRHYFATGCSHEEARLLLDKPLALASTTRDKALHELREFVSGLDIAFESTLWSNYQDKFDFSFDDEATNPDRHTRREVLKRMIRSTQPARVIDFGANAGFYSIFAAKCGAEVLAYEPDEPAAAKCHANFRSFSPDLRMKVAQGGFKSHEHRPGDLVMAIALTHHLFFTHMYKYEIIAKILAESTTRHLITEYMPNGLGVGKKHPDPLPEAYAVEYFLDELSKRFSEVHLIDYVNYTNRKLIVASK